MLHEVQNLNYLPVTLLNALSNAVIVASMSSSVCFVERNIPSNCDGGSPIGSHHILGGYKHCHINTSSNFLTTFYVLSLIIVV